jgi:hypothetical protein
MTQIKSQAGPGIKSARCDFCSMIWSFGHNPGRDIKYIPMERPWDRDKVAYLSSFAMIRDKAIYKNSSHDRNCYLSTPNEKTQKRLIKKWNHDTLILISAPKWLPEEGSPQFAWWKAQIVDYPLWQWGQRSEGMASSSEGWMAELWDE